MITATVLSPPLSLACPIKGGYRDTVKLLNCRRQPESVESILCVLVREHVVPLSLGADLEHGDPAPFASVDAILPHLTADGWPEGERCYRRILDLPDSALHSAARSLASEDLLPPVLHPPSFRDFYAFEAHVANARRKRGLEMIPEWYEAPVFYFSNTAALLGPNTAVRKPRGTAMLDYELELAVVIGREGRDIPVEEADGYIAGFTILNDWSARDIQRREMKVGLGPAKGKDFASSLGPYLVTPDELEDRVLPDRSRGKRYDLTMKARVNGKEYSRGNAREMHWTLAELIAKASENTVVLPGDLIGSGTVGTGCIVEFPDGTYPWLQPGDMVELEIERLGILRSRIVE